MSLYTKCYSCSSKLSPTMARCPDCLELCCVVCIWFKKEIDCEQCDRRTCVHQQGKCSHCNYTGHCVNLPSKICCQCYESIIIGHNQQIDLIKRSFMTRLRHPAKIVFEYVNDDIPIDYTNKGCVIL
jgi:hypothetical protein